MSDIRKDPRFSKALYDPQFHRLKKSSKTNKTDGRFKSFQKRRHSQTAPQISTRQPQSDPESSDYSESDLEDYEDVLDSGHPQDPNEKAVQVENIRLGREMGNTQSRPSNPTTKPSSDSK